jgi:hypothetical protein
MSVRRELAALLPKRLSSERRRCRDGNGESGVAAPSHGTILSLEGEGSIQHMHFMGEVGPIGRIMFSLRWLHVSGFVSA